MDRHEFEKNWTHWKNGVQTHWNKLTSGDIYQVDGMWDHLVTALVKRYGWSREKAEKEIDSWHPQWSDSMSREGNWDQNQAKKGMAHQNEKGHAWDKPKEVWSEPRSEGMNKEANWEQKQGKKRTGNQKNKGPDKNKSKDSWKEPPGWDEKRRKTG